MGAILGVIATGIVLVVLVVGLSMLTITRGYAYKHKIDPHPDEVNYKEEVKDKRIRMEE